MHLAPSYPAYTELAPLVPVYKVSRDGIPSIHRFYDTSPVSPSGRFLAITEFDSDDRLPAPGDEASVVVVDLASGEEVYRTRTIAWDTQLGAQAQWGVTDRELFFNRMRRDEWRPYGVKVDPVTAEEIELAGPVYMVSPDGRTAVSPNLVRIWLVQPGYGVVVPPDHLSEPEGAPDDDGLFVTDIESGTSRLALSFRQVYEAFPAEFGGLDLGRGGFYGFHAKWSPDGSRILFILRWKDRLARRNHTRNWILTMNSDFSDLKIALTADRWLGGHHPNWCPDSRHIIMNLMFPVRKVRFPKIAHLVDRVARRFRVSFYRNAYALRFALFRYDGEDLRMAFSDCIGSGHPTWHEGLNGVLTDAYPWEPVSAGDGTSPIRLISTDPARSLHVVQIRTKPDFFGPKGEWRVDPHPAWNRQGEAFVFNACPDGVRGVFVADMRGYMDQD